MRYTGDLHRVLLLQIRSGALPPADVFPTVRYERSRPWVEDRDPNSNRVFMLLRIFSSLAEACAQ